MSDHVIPPFCEAAKHSELSERAEAIIAKAKAKTSTAQDAEAGLSNPILFIEDQSPETQRVLQKYSEQRIAEALKAERAQEDVPSKAPTGNYSGFYSLSTVRGISHLLGRLPSNSADSRSAYALMEKLLQRLPLRWYDGKFYLFNEGVYQQVSDVKSLVFGCLEDELSRGPTNQLLRNTVDLLSSYPGIRVTTAQLPVAEVPFTNGILNVDTGTLRPVTPYDFFINYITVPYPSGVVQCPEFDRFLQTVSGGNPQIVETIWEMIGYMLTTDMDGKVLFILQGVGDSGKSVLGNLIASFFNEEAVAHLDIFRLGDRFSPSILQGKHLNICMDLPDGRIRKEAIGTIKQITGGDAIAIEGKFKDAKSLRPTCKFLFGTNFPLRIEHDQAFEGRCITIPFTVPIPKAEQDKDLLEKLKAERSAIAAIALRACQRLRSRNYEFIDLGTKGIFTGWTPQHKQLEAFLDTCCSFGPELYTPTVALFACFNDFCGHNHLSGISDPVQFSRQLNQLCRGRITPKRRRGPEGNLNGYDGIGLRDTGGMVNLL